MTKKENVDKWISENYSDLMKIITKFCGKYRKQGFEADLFSIGYMHLVKEKTLQQIKDENDMFNFFLNTCYKQVGTWKSSQFNLETSCTRRVNLIDTYLPFANVENNEMDLEEKLHQHYIYTQQVTAVELYKDRINKLPQNDIINAGKKKLINLYFNQEINTSGKLAKKLEVSRGTAYGIIKQMRDEINDIYTGLTAQTITIK